MSINAADFVLLIACRDRKGIVAAVANSIASQHCNIVESSQFGDAPTGRFFMRIALAVPAGLTNAKFTEAFTPVVAAYRLDWQVRDLADKLRTMIMVSIGGHCLNDYLYRTATGRLPMARWPGDQRLSQLFTGFQGAGPIIGPMSAASSRRDGP